MRCAVCVLMLVLASAIPFGYQHTEEKSPLAQWADLADDILEHHPEMMDRVEKCLEGVTKDLFADMPVPSTMTELPTTSDHSSCVQALMTSSIELIQLAPPETSSQLMRPPHSLEGSSRPLGFQGDRMEVITSLMTPIATISFGIMSIVSAWILGRITSPRPFVSPLEKAFERFGSFGQFWSEVLRQKSEISKSRWVASLCLMGEDYSNGLVDAAFLPKEHLDNAKNPFVATEEAAFRCWGRVREVVLQAREFRSWRILVKRGIKWFAIVMLLTGVGYLVAGSKGIETVVNSESHCNLGDIKDHLNELNLGNSINCRTTDGSFSSCRGRCIHGSDDSYTDALYICFASTTSGIRSWLPIQECPGVNTTSRGIFNDLLQQTMESVNVAGSTLPDENQNLLQTPELRRTIIAKVASEVATQNVPDASHSGRIQCLEGSYSDYSQTPPHCKLCPLSNQCPTGSYRVCENASPAEFDAVTSKLICEGECPPLPVPCPNGTVLACSYLGDSHCEPLSE